MALTRQYRLCQINGFTGGRIVAGPWEFSVTVVSYALGAEGWKIKFFDKADKTQQIAELSSDIGSGFVSSLGFDLVETGCGDFEIVFARDPAELPFTLEYNQGIEIYLYHDQEPWYAGYVTRLPVAGSTKRPWLVRGSGYYNQLETCIVDKDYTSQEISAIVNDLMDLFVEEKTDIVYAWHKIDVTDYTVAAIYFDHTTAKKAIEQLADLAQDWIFGVDANREIFFNGRDFTVNPAAVFAVGKHLDHFDVEEDATEIYNRIYIKAGLLSGSPKSNIQAEVSDYNSQVIYGVREAVLTAPSVRDADDAERWGNWSLADTKRPKQKARIPWADCSRAKIEAKGKARILALDGTIYELLIKKAEYEVDSKGIKCSLQLGKVETDLGKILRDALFKAANDELLQQQNVSQL